VSAFVNLVQFSTPTTGTGPLTVGAALPAKRTPAQSGLADGVEISYSIIDGLNFEFGRGIIGGSGTTLTRAPMGSSSGGAAIALSGNAKVAFVLLAEEIALKIPETRAMACLINIPPSVNALQTYGYAVTGDGGHARYKRVSAPDYPTYSFQSADFSWWQYIPEAIGWNAMVAGVRGDGSDDAPNLMKALLPFQEPSIIVGGKALSGTLLLPPAPMTLNSPIYITGNNGIAMKIQGQSGSNQGGNQSSTFVWGGSGYPSMVIVYGANQFEMSSVNFNGQSGSDLINDVLVTADNSLATDLVGGVGYSGSGPCVTHGANKTFTCAEEITGPGTAGVFEAAAIGVGPGTPNFEIVIVLSVSGNSFVANCLHDHFVGENVAHSPPTNNITFTRCAFGAPKPTVNNRSCGILIGNQLVSSVQAAQLILDSCIFSGGIWRANVSISNANPAVVTDIGHGMQNGTALQFETNPPIDPWSGGITGILPQPIDPCLTYYVTNAATDTYNLSLSIGGPLISTVGATPFGTPIRLMKGYAGLRAIVGSNIKNYFIHNCVFAHSEYGIAGESLAGSVEIFYGTFAGNLIADIGANGASNLHVTSCESETAGAAFLIGLGAGLNPQSATLVQNSIQTGLPADGYSVKWGGNLTMINNSFFSQAFPGASMAGVPPKIQGGTLLGEFEAGLPIRPKRLVPGGIMSIGNYFQDGNPDIPVFYDSSNNAISFDAGQIYYNRVVSFNDYCDAGWYPQMIGELSVIGSSLSTAGLGEMVTSPGTFVPDGVRGPPGFVEFEQTYTLPYTSFATAGTSIYFKLWAIPEKTVITGVIADVTKAFDGGLLLRIGDSNVIDGFIKMFDATSVVTKGLVDTPEYTELGSLLAQATKNCYFGFTNAFVAGDTMTIQAIGNVALNTLTKGSVTIHVTCKRFRS
jgi:hypothetical protein